MKSIIILTLATAVTALFSISCGVLEPVEDRSVNYVLEAAAPARVITGNSPVVAIARPSLPGYLDRQQLVTRNRSGNIVMNPNHLWAEPFDAGIARVTAENLGRIRNSLNIQPVEAFITLDYSHLLELRITRFDADSTTGVVTLECAWKLQPVSGRVAAFRAFRTEVPIGDDQYTAVGSQDARVAAMNRALAELAAAIAGGL
jgi:uncharacterized lipoprotein YmbA